jgi:diaminopimelate epimerase
MSPRAPIAFEKWEALANDFLLFFDVEPFPEASIRMACHRRLGAGADGALFARAGTAGPARRGTDGSPCDGERVGAHGRAPLRARKNGARWQVRLFNADGGGAEFSGNGFRCLAAAIFARHGRLSAVTLQSGSLPIDATRAGVDVNLSFDPRVLGNANVSEAPAPIARRVPRDFGVRDAQIVELANPHLVLWVDDALATSERSEVADALDGLRMGIPGFEGGINVSLASRAGKGRIAIVTWERGVGRTPACASAACATVFGARALGQARGLVEVVTVGGTMRVEARPDRVTLEGPARRVYAGHLDPLALEAP